MKRSALLLMLLLPALAPAQVYSPSNPPMVGPPPGVGPAALLYVRLDGPPGARAVWYQGQAKRDLAMPSVLGLRPGYVFRFEINNLPELPGVSLYPTLEVRGSLSMTSKARPRDFPAPVILTRDDLQAVLRGTLVTKVIFLEHPERAIPTATTIESPLETTLPPNRDLLEEAREQGRTVLVFRIGQRQSTAEELAQGHIPGTVLFPGQASLSRPTIAPILPFACWPWYDPVAGPARPDDECIHNGGITPAGPQMPLARRMGSSHAWMRAGLDANGRLAGLQPMDAVAEYRDARGVKRIVPSNRVCICIPRYQVLRSETPLSKNVNTLVVGEKVGVKGRDQFRLSLPPTPVESQHQMRAFQSNSRPTEAESQQAAHAIQRIEMINAQALMQGPIIYLGSKSADLLSEVQKAVLRQQIQWACEWSGRQRIGVNVGSQATHAIGRIEGGPQIIKATAETRSLTACCHEIAEVPGSPLLLFKCADTGAARVGAVITFTLKYANQGGKPIQDVALTDSLSPRLEYVPGSAEADRDAVFTTQENEAGSQILRWEITGVLRPGASGVVKFKARVR